MRSQKVSKMKKNPQVDSAAMDQVASVDAISSGVRSTLLTEVERLRSSAESIEKAMEAYKMTPKFDETQLMALQKAWSYVASAANLLDSVASSIA